MWFAARFASHRAGDRQQVAVLAEKDRALISQRTKAALAQAKARGVRLGDPHLVEVRDQNQRLVEAAERQAALGLAVIKPLLDGA